ncbi:MAG: lysophospholipid acyltransferase family protein [Bacteroidales bacterium]|jgi:1-acyl-sn-glycerol-3-phosphate acyltransferase|nr:lysophospholipid acyltransferase family protein [Bacteroidales bacterium]
MDRTLSFYSKFFEYILSRRYKITLKNEDILKTNTPKLILPNHQSHVDPQIIAVIVYRYAEFSPVSSERFFNTPVVSYFLKKLGAVKVKDFRTGSKDLNVLKHITEKVNEALSKGKNIIIFPAGKLTNSGLEKIQNKQSAYSVVLTMPDNVEVIGARFRGLWGSMWSKAWDGTRPQFLKTFLKGIFYLFANLFFFIPKRKVSIEFENITIDAKKNAEKGRKEFNAFLDSFYNKHGVEEPTYIKHFFYAPKLKKTLPEKISNL